MKKIKVVIDTNAFISSLSSLSSTHKLIELIENEEIDVCVTTEIMLEYEEKLKEKYSLFIVEGFLEAMKESINVYSFDLYFYWRLLNDLDDNKFVDCYISANADYLITNDTDFNKLKQVDFPKINIITLQEFLTLYNGEDNKK